LFRFKIELENAAVAANAKLELVRLGVIDIAEVRYPAVPRDDRKMSPIGISAFFGGLAGLGLALLFQYWTSAVDYPVQTGSKPMFSIVYSIPVTFAITALFACLAGFIAFLIKSRLPNWNYPTAAALENCIVLEFNSEDENLPDNFKFNYKILEQKRI
jgi:hypothetical protein